MSFIYFFEEFLLQSKLTSPTCHIWNFGTNCLRKWMSMYVKICLSFFRFYIKAENFDYIYSIFLKISQRFYKNKQTNKLFYIFLKLYFLFFFVYKFPKKQHLGDSEPKWVNPILNIIVANSLRLGGSKTYAKWFLSIYIISIFSLICM